MSSQPPKRLQRVGRATRKVLETLYAAAPEELWGYEISATTGLKGGSLYPVFRRLEEAGLVESRWEADEPSADRSGPRRRFYRLTPDGLAYSRDLLGAATVESMRPAPEAP